MRVVKGKIYDQRFLAEMLQDVRRCIWTCVAREVLRCHVAKQRREISFHLPSASNIHDAISAVYISFKRSYIKY